MIVRDYLAYRCGGFEVHKDAAHVVYTAYRRGYLVGAFDTSRLGGPWLDWVCFCSQRVAWVEVKTPASYNKPDHDLRPGEKWTIESLPIKTFVVYDDLGVAAMFDMLIDCK